MAVFFVSKEKVLHEFLSHYGGAMMNSFDIKRLVAHRGDHEDVPENTLVAFKKALEAGAQWLECDVQFSREGVPVLFHDETTQRMCHADYRIGELLCSELPRLLDGQPIPELEAMLNLLSGYPHAKLFMEVKREILQYFGIPEVVAKLGFMTHRNDQIIPISMSSELLEYWWRYQPRPCGWITAGKPPNIPLAYLLMPAEDFMRGERPASAGQVAVYTVNDIQYARELLIANADLVQTDHFSRMQQLLNVC